MRFALGFNLFLISLPRPRFHLPPPLAGEGGVGKGPLGAVVAPVRDAASPTPSLPRKRGRGRVRVSLLASRGGIRSPHPPFRLARRASARFCSLARVPHTAISHQTRFAFLVSSRKTQPQPSPGHCRRRSSAPRVSTA